MKKLFTVILIFNVLFISCDKIEKYNIFKKIFKSKKTPKQEQIVNFQDSIKVDTNIVETPVNYENTHQEINYPENNEKGIFMIAGAFLIPSNAERYVETLKEKGYNAFIIKGYGDFNMVAVEKYSDLRSAIRDLSKYRAELHPDAWIHIKH